MSHSAPIIARDAGIRSSRAPSNSWSANGSCSKSLRIPRSTVAKWSPCARRAAPRKSERTLSARSPASPAAARCSRRPVGKGLLAQAGVRSVCAGVGSVGCDPCGSGPVRSAANYSRRSAVMRAFALLLANSVHIAFASKRPSQIAKDRRADRRKCKLFAPLPPARAAHLKTARCRRPAAAGTAPSCGELKTFACDRMTCTSAFGRAELSAKIRHDHRRKRFRPSTPWPTRWRS